MDTMLLSPEHDAALAAADAALSLLAIDQYSRQLHWTVPMTSEEETTLLSRLARSRTAPDDAWLASLARQARDRIVQAYQPLIAHLAHRYARLTQHLDFMDCVQEGSMSLLVALDSYNAQVNGPFAAYAALYMRRAMARAIRSYDEVIRYPEYLLARMKRVRTALDDLYARWQRRPTIAELAVVVEMDEQMVIEVLWYCQCQRVESLEGLLDRGNMAGHAAEERIPFTHLWESSVLDDASAHVVEMVEQMVSTVLTPRQREVIQLRYGLGDRRVHSIAEVVSVLGPMCPQNVSLTEQRAKRNLRQALAPVVGERAS